MTQSHNWWTVENHINNWKGDTAVSFPSPEQRRIEELETQLVEQRSLVRKMDALLRQIQEDYPDVADMPTWSEVYESS